MSETIRMVRGHVDSWKVAYILISCMILSQICPYLVGELNGYAELSDIKGITLVKWFFACVGTAAVTIVAFITKGEKKAEDKKDEAPIDFTTINK